MQQINQKLKENIPKYLKDSGRFCLWKYEPDKDGRRTKVPYQALKPQYHASSTNINHFTGFEGAAGALAVNPGFDGLGVGVFQDNAGYLLAGIDIDHAVSGGILSGMAQDIVDTLDTYAEISPSGEGVRAFLKVPDSFPDFLKDNEGAQLYYKKKSNIGLEIYVAGDTKRYLTITGNRLNNLDVMERPQELLDVLNKYMRQEPKPKADRRPQASVEMSLTDRELIERAMNAGNGGTFRALWNGDISGYKSHSEADQALCNLLAFWTGCDARRIDSLFRQSGLYRKKWERADVSGKTIKKAIDGCTAVYNPADYYGRGDVITTNNAGEPDALPGAETSIKPGASISTNDNGSSGTDAEPEGKPKVAFQGFRYKPPGADYTDTAQALLFVREYGHIAKWHKGTDWLCYDGKRWRMDTLKEHDYSQELSRKQLDESGAAVKLAEDLILKAKIAKDNEAGKHAERFKKTAMQYFRHALDYRESRNIKAFLCEARPHTLIPNDDNGIIMLDRNPYLLNTPAGTVDLKTGQMRKHSESDLITKMTAVSPSNNGMEIWQAFLNDITCGDKELQEYHKAAAGMMIIGEVKEQRLLIANGAGGGGKSTYYNTLYAVLGTYSGTISSDILTLSEKGFERNKLPGLAELQGRRFVISGELKEGAKLDIATVKKICSTDPIHCEPKYKQPYDFLPSHTIVLYTNFLPKTRGDDGAIWDRLRVIPFNGRFRGTDKEITNYSSYLVENAGGAILQWMIEGAIMFQQHDYKLPEPKTVSERTAEYREESNTISRFISECCERDKESTVITSKLYNAYIRWCEDNREYHETSKKFTQLLKAIGIENGRSGVRFYRGVKLIE